jgi:hypothetical protein
MNRVQFQAGLSMFEFHERYGSDEKCEAALAVARWPDGFECPRCQGRSAYSFRRGRQPYRQCFGCGYQCSVIAGTIFLKGGSVNVVHVNTGAFQRVASPAQIRSILAQPKMKSKSALDLLPDNLPPCYNFAWVEPYKEAPGVKLLRWSQRSDGTFADSQGTCLDSN